MINCPIAGSCPVRLFNLFLWQHGTPASRPLPPLAGSNSLQASQLGPGLPQVAPRRLQVPPGWLKHTPIRPGVPCTGWGHGWESHSPPYPVQGPRLSPGGPAALAGRQRKAAARASQPQPGAGRGPCP